MAVVFRAGICALLCFILGVQAVTPMEKVITLLKSLSVKVAAEGKKDAAQYDKYACFCKEQADEKLYAIEKSDAKISSLSAEIKQLDAEIAELNTEVKDLSTKITNLGTEIQTKTEKRDGEHAKYLVKAKDMNDAIGACSAAIESLRNSKTAMKGAKLDLAQVKKATGALLGYTQLLKSAPGAVALLSELHGKAAPKFEYQSNDIIATLEALNDSFKDMKKNLDTEEFDINSSFESDRLGLQNEKKFAEKEKGEKETLVESKTEQLETAKNSRSEESSDRDADQNFMDELTRECEEKATLFDQRSKQRSDELTALSEATTELEKGAVPNFSTNKKLNGLEIKAAVKRVSAPAFVQTSSVENKPKPSQKVLQRVLSFLNAAATRTGSVALTNAAMRVKLSEDHFVKVRALIKDLVAKLEADAEAEATQKSYCDKNMAKAIEDRDEANGQIEAASAKITTLTANKASLEADMRRLRKEISDNKKALLEATELRDADKAENTKTLRMSTDGIASVKQALELLQNFYGKSLAQTAKYTPPNSGRDGKTVGDMAPESFDSEYHGSKSESKGIIGILEVILSDFERTEKKTEEDEKDSKEAFEMFEKDTQDDIDEKDKSVIKKEGLLSETESDLVDEQNNLMEANKLLDSSKEKLDGLIQMCVKGEESWEERKKKREEEIEALKSAMEILNEWQN